MSRWRRGILVVLRGSLLADGLVLAGLGLLTVVKWPIWTGWMAELWPVGMVVPEIGLWLALAAMCVGLAAWGLGRKHRVVAGVTVGLCLVATALDLKPAVQAWRLRRGLAGELEAAFGKAEVTRRPFSVGAVLVGGRPEEVEIEEREYAPGLKLDFYRGAGSGPRPCVVVIHGGSWVGGDRKENGTKRWMNDYLARRGYAVASIDYRLAPQWKWPAQREDVVEATAYLRGHAGELAIDPGRMVLMGRSAGGQMVLATAYWMRDPGIRGVVAIYPVTDFRRTWEVSTWPRWIDHRVNLEWFLGGTPETAGEAFRTASAVELVGVGGGEMPATLILQGKLDVNVDYEQAERLAGKLRGAGAPHLLVSLPWGGHAFDLVGFNTPGAQVEAYAVEWFLQTVTR